MFIFERHQLKEQKDLMTYDEFKKLVGTLISEDIFNPSAGDDYQLEREDGKVILRVWLRKEGYPVREFHNLDALEAKHPDFVVVDKARQILAQASKLGIELEEGPIFLTNSQLEIVLVRK